MNRWVRIAERILEDFKNEKELHIITLMEGGFRFFEDLKICLNDQLRFVKGPAIKLHAHFVNVST